MNLRVAPNKNAVSLGKYYTGVIVVVKDDRHPVWWKVKIESTDVTGYMDSTYLVPCGEGRRDEAVIRRVGSAKPQAVVSGQRPQDGLHLRDRASDKGNSLGKFYNGTAVEILGLLPDESWYHVYVPQTRQIGYMLAKYVKVVGVEEQIVPPPGISWWAVVNNPNPADRLNLRASPSVEAASLGKYYNGTVVEILLGNGAWCKVRVDVDGKIGYMMRKYLVEHYLLKDPPMPGGGGYGQESGQSLQSQP
ncbi:MAG: SH3 domain-containing protein [Firmicutes bacterium]|nr:SH3 domain-containing protein [Bacillota bacterium]